MDKLPNINFLVCSNAHTLSSYRKNENSTYTTLFKYNLNIAHCAESLKHETVFLDMKGYQCHNCKWYYQHAI